MAAFYHNQTSSGPASTPATGTTTNHVFQGNWYGVSPVDRSFHWGYDLQANINDHSVPSGSFNGQPICVAEAGGSDSATVVGVTSDRLIYSQGISEDCFNNPTSFPPVLAAKSAAMLATAGTPQSSSVLATTATIACDYTPNTYASVATVWLEYKRSVDSVWIQAGAQDTGKSGYSLLNISRNLTGLTGNTQYDFRLHMTRNTGNDGTLTSSIQTFTTQPDVPSITTNAASNIGPNGATLNGTVNPNGLSTTYRFVWGTTPGGPYPNETAAQGPDSGTSPIAYSQAISGLSPTTPYYYKAKATAGGVDYFGSEVQFNTAASAAQARIMPSIFQFDAKYGSAVAAERTFQFCVEVPSATNSDQFLNAAVPWVAGDVLIDKDGAGFLQVSALPTRIGTTQLYQWVATAAELSARQVTVLLTDVAGGPLWRDTLLLIRTKQHLGQIDVDASVIGGNTDAMKLTGVGTGLGLNAAGGATAAGDIGGVLASHVARRGTAQAGAASSVTLDSGASATNNYYNGYKILIVSGTGAGQCRVITAYDGTSKVATVNRSWSANPASGSVFILIPGEDVWNIPLAELASQPTAGDASGVKAQFVFQRFAFKRTQTATTQTLIKSDNSTTLASASVSDDGTTQTTGKLT